VKQPEKCLRVRVVRLSEFGRRDLDSLGIRCQNVSRCQNFGGRRLTDLNALQEHEELLLIHIGCHA
jgi:hypothetical protein